MGRLAAQDGEAARPLALAEARAAIAGFATPVGGIESVPLASLDGRVLARDIVAPHALPPFANAAVDGYAVRFDDLAAAGETSLPVLSRIAAGQAAKAAMAGAAARIFTGAPLPPGADTVFMQEDVIAAGASVRLPAGIARGANRREAGEDVPAGARVLAQGRRLRPQDVALLAALGFREAPVRRRLRVAVFSTGDELVEPGAVLGPARIYDANRSLLLALAARAGAQVNDLGIVPDRADALRSRLAAAAADADLVLTSGGVSAGEEDHVRAAVAALGSLDLWKVALKPGKPVALGRIGETPFMGLPGNPVAAFVTFALLGRALIAGLQGETFVPPWARPVRLGFAHRKPAGRREYLPVTLALRADGEAVAARSGTGGAALLGALAASDGLVEFGEDVTAADPGETVPFLAHEALAG